MKHLARIAVICLTFSGVAHVAAQYEDPMAPPPPPPPAGTAPAQPAPQTAVAPPPPPPPPPQSQTTVYYTQPQPTYTSRPPSRQPRAQISGFIGVPVFVSDEHEVASPGVGLSGRYGWHASGYVVPQFGGGWQIQWLDLSNADPMTSFPDNQSMTLFYFNLGVRFQVPNESKIIPFASVNLDFNFWHLEGDYSVTCGGYYYWWCGTVNNYHYEPGVSSRIGAMLKLNAGMALEIGVRVGTSFGTEFFAQPETWLDPYIGFTGFM